MPGVVHKDLPVDAPEKPLHRRPEQADPIPAHPQTYRIDLNIKTPQLEQTSAPEIRVQRSPDNQHGAQADPSTEVTLVLRWGEDGGK